MGLDLCQVPDGCRLVLLPLLAAKIFVRCPRLQRKGGGYLRMDSLRRGRAWLSAGRRVLELFGSASGVVGQCPEDCAWVECCRNAHGDSCDPRSSFMGAGHL